MTKRLLTILPVLAATALVAAGCGNDDKTSSDAGTARAATMQHNASAAKADDATQTGAATLRAASPRCCRSTSTSPAPPSTRA